MIKKTVISENNISSFLGGFDRVFLSKCLTKVNNFSGIAEFLNSHNLKKRSVLLLKNDLVFVYTNNKSFIEKLNNYDLLFKKGDGSIPNLNSDSFNAAKNLSSKYKLLFIFGDSNNASSLAQKLYDENLTASVVTFNNNIINIFSFTNDEEKIDIELNVKGSCDDVVINFYKDDDSANKNLNYLTVKHSYFGNNKAIFSVNKSELISYNKLRVFCRCGNNVRVSPTENFLLLDDFKWTISFKNEHELICSKTNSEFTTSDFSTDKFDNDINYVKFNYYGGQSVALPKTSFIKGEKLQENSVVYDKNHNRILLKRALGSGGEGTVYSTDKIGTVVKIFKSNQNDDIKRQKIEFMANNQLNNDLIVWPKQSVYDSNQNFVGFTMNSAEGQDLGRFVNATIHDTSFNILKVDKKTILKMIISILTTLNFLHKRNIIVGDIKLENLIIKNSDPTRVYFVDCDSYQIDKFPATKVSYGFEPPELLGKKVDLIYRTFENENYATFTLLFMILTKGCKPYEQLNTEDPYQKLASEGLFPYSLDADQTKIKARKGYPIVNWSHFPSYIKEAFINVGLNTGKYFTPKNRLGSEKWLSLFKQYLSDLEKGRLNKDPNANVGICDPRDPVLDYSLVNIEELKEYNETKCSMNLKDLIQLFINDIGNNYGEVDTNKVYYSLRNNGTFKSSNVEFILRKNIGVMFMVECKAVV